MAGPDAVMWPVGYDCTFKAMYAFVPRNAVAGNSALTLRKGTPNGADTTQTITIGAGATGSFSDESHPVAFTKGQLFGIQFVAGGGGTTVAPPTVCLVRTKTPGV